MKKVERTIIIEAPVQEVFSYAANWQFWSDWFDGFTNCSSITEIERGNGAIYDYKMWVLGIPFRTQTEIHNFVENKGWSGHRIKGVPHKTTWIFEDVEGHTKFTYIVEYSLPIPILGPILCLLLMNNAWRRILKKSLNNLTAHFQG
jgi:coenzyme Q-binding protein COQ10